jgi:hypothetical protein
MKFKAERRPSPSGLSTEYIVVDEDADESERVWCIVRGSSSGQRTFRAQHIAEKLNKGSELL